MGKEELYRAVSAIANQWTGGRSKTLQNDEQESAKSWVSNLRRGLCWDFMTSSCEDSCGCLESTVPFKCLIFGYAWDHKPLITWVNACESISCNQRNPSNTEITTRNRDLWNTKSPRMGSFSNSWRHPGWKTFRVFYLFQKCVFLGSLPCSWRWGYRQELQSNNFKGVKNETKPSWMILAYKSSKFTKLKSRMPCWEQLKKPVRGCAFIWPLAGPTAKQLHRKKSQNLAASFFDQDKCPFDRNEKSKRHYFLLGSSFWPLVIIYHKNEAN